MKKKKRFAVVFIILIPWLLCSCNNSKEDCRPKGLKYDVPGVPSIEEFSGTHYEDYECIFPPVSSAVYRNGNTEETIQPNDARLIRLLNSIAYSQEKQLTAMIQGYLEDGEIIELLSSDEPMLEINFLKPEHPVNSSICTTSQIVICGDSFLLILGENPDWYAGDRLAERYWPYASVVSDTMDIENEQMRDDILSHNGWGDDYWIDLLEYSGF